MVRGAIAGGISFLAVHAVWVAIFLAYTALRTGGRYLGTSIDKVPNLVEVILGHFALKTLIPAVAFAAVVSVPLALLAAWTWPTRSWRAAAVLGAATYPAITAALLLAGPAAFVRLPIFSRWPIGLDLAIAALTIAVLLVKLFHRAPWAGLGWLAVVSIPTWCPHDILRVVRDYGAPHLVEGAPRTLLFVVDALRLDTFCATAPEPWRRDVLLGVSHFGSTRKQYRLLFTGDAAAVAPTLFIPSRHELEAMVPESLLTHRVERSGRRVAFLIDDPLTASAASIGISPHEYDAPADGIQDALLAGTWMVPLASWLWNIAGPVEGINPWSDFATLLRDTERALHRNAVVIAHTVWLQHPPYRYDELRRAGGERWWRRAAGAFEVRIEQVPHTDTGFVDARAVYVARAAAMLAAMAEWQPLHDARVAAVVTSDHGQRFPPSDRPGVAYGGLHGWDLSPETVWIPILPLGRARATPAASSVLSWLDLRAFAIDTSVGTVALPHGADSIILRLPFIAATQFLPRNAEVPADILTPSRIISSISLDWTAGWVVDSVFAYAPHPSAYGVAHRGTLNAVNPDPLVASRMVARRWRGYDEVFDSTTSVPKVNATTCPR